MIEWRCLTKKKNPVSTYFDCVFNMSSYFLILVKGKNTNLESEKRIIDNHSNHAICTSTYFGGTNTIQCIVGCMIFLRFRNSQTFLDQETGQRTGWQFDSSWRISLTFSWAPNIGCLKRKRERIGRWLSYLNPTTCVLLIYFLEHYVPNMFLWSGICCCQDTQSDRHCASDNSPFSL